MPPKGEGQAYFQVIVTKEVWQPTVLNLALKNMDSILIPDANTPRGGTQVAMYTLQKSSTYQLILLSTGSLIIATSLRNT